MGFILIQMQKDPNDRESKHNIGQPRSETYTRTNAERSLCIEKVSTILADPTMRLVLERMQKDSNALRE